MRFSVRVRANSLEAIWLGLGFGIGNLIGGAAGAVDDPVH